MSDGFPSSEFFREQKFRFRQQDFLGYIGDSDKLLKYLLYNNWEDAE